MERQAHWLSTSRRWLPTGSGLPLTRVWLGSLLGLALLTACDGPNPRTGARADEVAVHVERVGLDAADLPVVILEENEGARSLPIWIGSAEAWSIARVMGRHHASRPNTHDLARNLIEGLDAEVLRVSITELRENTYYAALKLRVRGQVVTLDSRPSDAIAIALRANAPIFVREVLFREGGDELSPAGEAGEPQLRI